MILNKEQLFNKTDNFLILGLVAIGAIAWIINYALYSESNEFIIKSYSNDIETEQTIVFDSDQKLKIVGREGEMLIEVSKQNGVRVASSTCKCQICVNSGWSKSESLICVPNGVVIMPKLKNESSVDAVTR